MSYSFSKEEVQTLVQSTDFRDFMKRVLDLRSSKNKKFTYADLARASQFSSRSYPRDIILGLKTPTSEGLDKLGRGLGFDPDLKDFFRYLVHLEILSLRPVDQSEDDVRNKLENLKGRLLNRQDNLLSRKEAPYSNFYIPTIYAGLGDQENGANLEEIKIRTSLPENVIKAALRDMLEMGIATFKDNRFKAAIGHLSLQYLNNKTYYKNYYKWSLGQVLDSLDANFQKDGHLFFTSSFSIDEKKMPELKEELRRVLLQFVDKNEAPVGQKVVQLNCSLKI